MPRSDEELLAGLNAGLGHAPESELLAAADTLATIDPKPILTTVRRWHCPFCRFVRSSRETVVKHIGQCWKNPAVRGCKTCRNFCQQEPEPENGVPAAEWCDADVSLPESGLVANCPLWTLRGAS